MCDFEINGRLLMSRTLACVLYLYYKIVLEIKKKTDLQFSEITTKNL